MIGNNEIIQYLENLIPTRSEVLIEMEAYAKEHNVPIMELIGIEMILQLLKLAKPKRILEIGTAIGYSAIRMAEALPDCEIVTIERDEVRYQKALTFIAKAQMENRITVILGDALEIEGKLEKQAPFDVLFIDAAKGQYQRFFEKYSSYVKNGGTIISDNVLFKGYVANIEQVEKKRLKSLAKKLSTYNEWLMNLANYDTSIIPIGDGVAISIKGEEGDTNE
ncbi:O-methyltransferase [Bacillus alkalicellulosilyticus]|uniref:O-methyltransferase n=1 Tax=Alkalihalobacterium alkalicellulosilyticum TaxID=1912214 RepID=UPI00099643D1|nr:O-methyltransferase [Bacillus alkalicellulosilyticus]